jgi:hypothetical protein
MSFSEIKVTDHAARRMTQRNLETWDVELVLNLGRVIHRTGATFYFLGRRDLPVGAERALESLVGTTVIVEEGRVRTVYRNRRALQKIRRKPKRSRLSEQRRELRCLLTSASTSARS